MKNIMNIQIENGHCVSKIEDTDICHEITFANEESTHEMDVRFNSLEEEFFETVGDDRFAIAIVDRHLIGLINNQTEEIHIVKDFVFAHGETTLLNDNIKYIEREYAIDEEELRRSVGEAYKNNFIKIEDAIVADAYDNARNMKLVLATKEGEKELYVLNGTPQAIQMIELANIGRDITSWGPVINALVDKTLRIVLIDGRIMGVIDPKTNKVLLNPNGYYDNGQSYVPDENIQYVEDMYDMSEDTLKSNIEHKLTLLPQNNQ